MKLGEILKQHRAARALDQGQLAKNIGISQSMLSKIETEQKNELRASDFIKILEWLMS